VVVLEVLKFRGIRERQIRRQVESGEIEAVRPPETGGVRGRRTRLGGPMVGEQPSPLRIAHLIGGQNGEVDSKETLLCRLGSGWERHRIVPDASEAGRRSLALVDERGEPVLLGLGGVCAARVEALVARHQVRTV
jgi:hypothetical protein